MVAPLKTNGKMKTAGYILLAAAFVLSLLIFFDAVDESPTKITLIQYWAGLGLALLLGNASKNIVGGHVQNKAMK